ncbi:MAG: hypothetical protein ACYDHY_07640 [Acidiferrobacterales bacterium]
MANTTCPNCHEPMTGSTCNKCMQARIASGNLPFQPSGDQQKKNLRTPKLEMGCGAAMAGPGPQMPSGIRKRKKKVESLLRANPDITVREAVAYFSTLDEGMGEVVGKRLDAGSFSFVGDAIREHLIREVVANRVKEVVRKKKDGNAYVLYRPNTGKKGSPKPVATYPTKLAAKRAELAKYPPKDAGKKARLSREIQKLQHAKDEKGKGKESGTPEDFKARAAREKAKKEEFLRPLIASFVMESLIKEDAQEWIQFLNRVPKAALAKDKKFASLQKKVDKTAEKTLDLAFKSIVRSVGKSAKLRSHGVRRDEANRPFISFTAEINGVEADPFNIRLSDAGIPSLEVTQKAKGDLAKADPNVVKLFRAELIQAQEQILDDMNLAQKELAKRDAYLDKSQGEIDSFVSELSPLGLSLLKQLLVQKYRKIG